MFMKKSVLLGVALVLALVCAGTISSFAAVARPAAPIQAHTAAHPAHTAHTTSGGILSRAAILRRLSRTSFPAGATVNNLPPIIEDLRLANLGDLNRHQNFALLPGTPNNRPVFLVRLLGPFILSHDSSFVPDRLDLFDILNDWSLLDNANDGLFQTNVEDCNMNFCQVTECIASVCRTDCNVVDCNPVNTDLRNCTLLGCLGQRGIVRDLLEVLDARDGGLLGLGLE